jgi:hypothetical protein
MRIKSLNLGRVHSDGEALMDIMSLASERVHSNDEALGVDALFYSDMECALLSLLWFLICLGVVKASRYSSG